MGIVENTYAELKQQELKNNPYSCLHMADIDINTQVFAMQWKR